MTKYLAAALLTTALFACTASAQTASNKTAAADSAAERAASAHKEGEWRASKLVGVNVYNEANEKIGDINDVILDAGGPGCRSLNTETETSRPVVMYFA